jgi:hypothetical protein
MQNHLVMGLQLPVSGGNDVLNYMLKVECLDLDPDTGRTTTQVCCCTVMWCSVVWCGVV